MSASILQKTLGFFGFGDEQSGFEEEMDPIRQPQAKRRGILSLSSAAASSEIVVIEPTKYDDVQNIADHLKLRQSVVVNLQNVPQELLRRIVDFCSGVIYTLEGNMQKVSEAGDIFLFTPANVDIIAEKKVDTKGTASWFFQG